MEGGGPRFEPQQRFYEGLRMRMRMLTRRRGAHERAALPRSPGLSRRIVHGCALSGAAYCPSSAPGEPHHGGCGAAPPRCEREGAAPAQHGILPVRSYLLQGHALRGCAVLRYRVARFASPRANSHQCTAPETTAAHAPVLCAAYACAPPEQGATGSGDAHGAQDRPAPLGMVHVLRTPRPRTPRPRAPARHTPPPRRTTLRPAPSRTTQRRTWHAAHCGGNGPPAGLRIAWGATE